ncbi:tryptophan synthase subunit alpha [Desulfothermus okinawensis JCM 13304]
MSKNILENIFHKKNKQGKKTIMPFLPAGYPNKKKFWDYIKEMDECGADIIEIGVPFSDPVADGPVVEKASNIALENGVNLEWILEGLNKNKKDLSCEVVLMGYCNPFFKYGFEKLAKGLKESGASGIIIADLPLEESIPIKPIFDSHNISLIYLVGLNTYSIRLEKYSKLTSGFVYFVSVLGTTGARDRLPEELKQKLKSAREIFDLPLAIGFGIKSPSQLIEINPYIDGIVFGSSIIEHITNGKDIKEFFKVWI